jgi:dipeptidyl aminopeptidase/acylaminoacyl peptidase
MGFAVVQLNGRGAWGLGLKQRQSLTAGYDLVQVEDIVTTVTRLEEVFHVNLKRVALVGRGHGGFIALRAMQEHPDKFRCAIALEAPVNLASWLEEQRWSENAIEPFLTRGWLGDKGRLEARPLVSRPEAVTKPVMLLNYPGADGEVRHATFVAARNFAGSVQSRGGSAEFGVLHHDYMRGLPDARAEVFGRMEEFLNLNLYDFKVKLPELKVVQR